MAEESTHYHLWPHTVRAPRKEAQCIIAKVTAGESARSLAAVTRAARSVGPAADETTAFLARLVENGHASAVNSVFDDAPARGARTLAALAATGARGGGRPRAHRSTGIVEIRVSRGTSPKRLASHVAKMNGVEYAFVPPTRSLFVRRPRGDRPDPLASRQWSHGAIRLRDARAAQGFQDASNVTVAVVDSGIDSGHPDLAAVIDEYKNFLRESDKDYVGHGTHVAGIIAAAANNGLGISGVCAARILALKALPRDDGDFDATAYYRALRYVVGRAQVLNLSLGGEKDPAEIDVLQDVMEAGVVVVAAMGNEYADGNPVEYPAAIRGVCAVGATDQGDQRAGFSNTGPHVDLVAPGVAILSTTPTYAYDDGQKNYDSWDGTSMATPHVAGAAALVLAKHPGWQPAQVIARLKARTDRVAGAKKRSAAYGAGRLNCEKALR